MFYSSEISTFSLLMLMSKGVSSDPNPTISPSRFSIACGYTVAIPSLENQIHYYTVVVLLSALAY